MSKELIIETSKNLFMKYGIKSISMDDIAKDLGMSKKTIYNFVDNKDDLVLSVLQSHSIEEKEMVQNIRSVAQNAIEEMASIAKYVLQHMREMKPTLMYDLKKYHFQSWNFLTKDHFAFIEDAIQQNISRGKKEGLYRSKIDETIHSKIYVSMARIMVDEEVFPIKEYDKGDIYENYFIYHMNGIMNEDGRTELNKYLNQEK